MATGTTPRTNTRAAKKGASGTKQKKENCIVCEKAIKDSDEANKVKGQDSLLCEGNCQRWMYRICAGISKQAQLEADNSNDPFLCHRCISSRQTKEIITLQAMVSRLESELTSLKAKLDPLSVLLQSEDVRPSYASRVRHASSETTTQLGFQSQLPNKNQAKARANPNPDRKFNIVVYGTMESPDGTPRQDRMAYDNQEVLDVIETVESTITVQLIRDCFRMGKYLKGKKRPILVKMSRTREVQSILANRRKLAQKPSVSIKPDMSFEERAVEKILLKKRWELMGQGVEKGKIKIRGKTLSVNNVRHGFVNASTCVQSK